MQLRAQQACDDRRRKGRGEGGIQCRILHVGRHDGGHTVRNAMDERPQLDGAKPFEAMCDNREFKM